MKTAQNPTAGLTCAWHCTSNIRTPFSGAQRKSKHFKYHLKFAQGQISGVPGLYCQPEFSREVKGFGLNPTSELLPVRGSPGSRNESIFCFPLSSVHSCSFRVKRASGADVLQHSSHSI